MTLLEYTQICSVLQGMKIIHGPEWLNATLRRHKDLLLALQDFEKTFIVDLESKIIRG